MSDKVYLHEETHWSSLHTTTGWQLAEARASGASKSIPWNFSGYREVGGYLNMKEKLPLKVVSILDKDMPRGRTRTHPTQNQHSTRSSTVPAGCWWDDRPWVETWKGWKSGRQWDVSEVEDLVWWCVVHGKGTSWRLWTWRTPLFVSSFHAWEKGMPRH